MAPGLNGPPTQQNFSLPFRNTARHDFGILVVNGLAVWANGTQECFTIGNFLLDAVPTFTAKIDGWDHLTLDVKWKIRLKIFSLCMIPGMALISNHLKTD
jgi:hypothetical protein